MPKSRKRKQGRKLGRSSGQVITVDSKSDFNEFLGALKLQLVNLAIVITASLTMRFFGSSDPELFYQKVPAPLRIAYVIALLLLTAKSTWVACEYFYWKKREDYRYIKKMIRLDLVLTIIIFSIVTLVILFEFDVPSKLATYVGSSLSVVLSMVISGVVGNFAYDLLKRMVMGFNKPKASEERSKSK